MSKIAYETWRPQGRAKRTVADAIEILEEYAAQGYDLTLRQLYYQFVARGKLPANTLAEYKALAITIKRGRLAGLIDWDHIVDRTRNLGELPIWESPEQLLASAAEQYREDRWEGQDCRVECWTEKDALLGIVEQVASRWRCPWFSCRGYDSISEVFDAAQRFRLYIEKGQRVVVLYAGDHDPSGLDALRDILERLARFIFSDIEGRIDEEPSGTRRRGFTADAVAWVEGWLEVRHVALTTDQVRQYDPPPNFAKETDMRMPAYAREHGQHCWELDALPPDVLISLYETEIRSCLDFDAWRTAEIAEERGRVVLRSLSEDLAGGAS